MKRTTISWEELKVYSLWALLAGVVLALLIWGSGCAAQRRPTVQPRPTKPVSTFKKSRCRTVYATATPCVRVVIRRDCLSRNTTDITMIVTYLQDNGRQAALDSADILLRYYGELPDLATMAMTMTPNGWPAYVFVIVGFNGPELLKIDRHQKIKHLPK